MNNKKVAGYTIAVLACLIIINSGIPSSPQGSPHRPQLPRKMPIPSPASDGLHEEKPLISEKERLIKEDPNINLNQIKASNMDAYLRAVKLKSMSAGEISESMKVTPEQRKELARIEVKKALIEHLNKKQN